MVNPQKDLMMNEMAIVIVAEIVEMIVARTDLNLETDLNLLDQGMAMAMATMVMDQIVAEFVDEPCEEIIAVVVVVVVVIAVVFAVAMIEAVVVAVAEVGVVVDLAKHSKSGKKSVLISMILSTLDPL
jgi:hypothetical protein